MKYRKIREEIKSFYKVSCDECDVETIVVIDVRNATDEDISLAVVNQRPWTYDRNKVFCGSCTCKSKFEGDVDGH